MLVIITNLMTSKMLRVDSNNDNCRGGGHTLACENNISQFMSFSRVSFLRGEDKITLNLGLYLAS